MALNQQLQMASLRCNKVNHQDEHIRALCMRVGCDKPPAQCYKCTLELHKECVHSTVMINDIPKLLQPFLQMKLDLTELQSQMNQQINKLLVLIEQTFGPIRLYIESSNLTNLNGIGVFLRKKEQEILSSQIEKILQSITNLFVETKIKYFPQAYQENTLGDKIKEPTKSAQEWINLGNYLFDLRKYEESLECGQKALEIDPNNSNVLVCKGINYLMYLSGQALYKLDKCSESLQCFEQAIQIEPKNSKAWSGKGDVLNKLKTYKKAIECQKQAIKLDFNNCFAWNGQGIFYFILIRNILWNSNQMEDALKCYEQAIVINPKYINAWLNKGDLLYALKQDQQSLECYEIAINIDPKYIESWICQGRKLYDLNLNEKAFESYQQALKIDPKNIKALQNNGELLCRMNKTEKGLECLKYILKLDPNNIKALGYIGAVLCDQDKLEEGQQYFENIISIDPNNFLAWGYNGDALYQLKQYDQAMKCYDQAMKLKPDKYEYKESYEKAKKEVVVKK